MRKTFSILRNEENANFYKRFQYASMKLTRRERENHIQCWEGIEIFISFLRSLSCYKCPGMQLDSMSRVLEMRTPLSCQFCSQENNHKCAQTKICIEGYSVLYYLQEGVTRKLSECPTRGDWLKKMCQSKNSAIKDYSVQ